MKFHPPVELLPDLPPMRQHALIAAELLRMRAEGFRCGIAEGEHPVGLGVTRVVFAEIPDAPDLLYVTHLTFTCRPVRWRIDRKAFAGRFTVILPAEPAP